MSQIPDSAAKWRGFADWGKRRPWALKLADKLGRSRGRLRLQNFPKPLSTQNTPNLKHWENHRLALAWLGHASVLLRLGGQTILADPVASKKVGIGIGPFTFGPGRVQSFAVELSMLPRLDVVLLTHAHFDHLDRPTLQKLPRDVQVICAAGTADLVKDLRFKQVRELATGESTTIDDLKITAVPVCHWGARVFFDAFRGFNGYLLEGISKRVLFAPDSGYHEANHLLAPVDLAIMGIGAYNPYIDMHANPEQMWAMAMHANAAKVAAIHHTTFKLSYEPMHEPLARLLAAAGERSGDVVIREVGDVYVDD